MHSLDQLSTPSSSSDGSVSDATSSSSSNGSGSAGVRIPRLEGDFSLNAANTLSADLLLRSGLSRLCPTHDLNVSWAAGIGKGKGSQLARSISPRVLLPHKKCCWQLLLV